MINVGYHMARRKGAFIRRGYRQALHAIVRRPVNPRAEFPIEVFAYSSEADLPEQIASVRSFLRHAGRPSRFTIVSDGSHSVQSIQLLQALDPSVVVSSYENYLPSNVPQEFACYLRSHPTGRQLSLVMSLGNKGPCVYTDADVLFFPGANQLKEIVLAIGAPARYLPDCQLSGDQRLFRSTEELNAPVNTGFLVLGQPLDWSLSIERFLQLSGPPEFFTNQTMTHLTMHAAGAAPLDADKFILQLDDQFIYPDKYASRAIALRHYVNPVRHKFWCAIA